MNIAFRQFFVKKNSHAIACYKACGFGVVGEGTKPNQKGEEISFFEIHIFI